MSSPPGEPTFSEREFYLREFRGRTLGIAWSQAEAEGLAELAGLLAELAKGGVRSVLLLKQDAPALEALGARIPARAPRLEAACWRVLREASRVSVTVAPEVSFSAACRDLSLRLGLFKLVWLDAGGGFRDAAGRRVSFLDLQELRRLLGSSEGPLRDERLPLWREVEALLEAGVSAVNVCDAPGLEDELFTYAGSGTLFTRERYVSVRRLGVDDYDAAHDLIARGVAEGYLAPRSPEQIDGILASGFGAFIEDRHLAGIGALLTRAGSRGGEIASLYTLTRFLGEGVGGDLVAFGLERARKLGLDFVFACTTSERVGLFFERLGFAAVGPEQIPAAKWLDYDPERRPRLRCYRHEVG